MISRRIKAFEIQPEFLMALFQKSSGLNLLVEGLPVNAEFRGFNHSYEKNCMVFFVESEEFDEVPEGTRFPSGTLSISIVRQEQEGFLPSFVDDEGRVHGR